MSRKAKRETTDWYSALTEYLFFFRKHKPRDIAHRDTLRQLLNDPSIFINRIQYENSERLIDYTDSTDIIKAAHFRKDGSIRITDSPEVVTLHDARTEKKVRWKTIK